MATQRRGGVHEALTSFASLLAIREGKSPGDAQKQSRIGLPKRLTASRLKLRKPDAPVSHAGKRLILGIASYSRDELSLLDQIQDSWDESAPPRSVEVFDVVDCREMSDFDRFIPGIGDVYQSPVIGVFVGGKLVESASGLPDVLAALERWQVLGG